jgi:hypothetical protein
LSVVSGFSRGDVEQRGLRRPCLRVHQIHNHALILANNSGVRFGHKIAHRHRVPVIPASHSALIVQPLLHDGPLAS